MSHSKAPHTVIAFTRNGRLETLGRPGLLTVPNAVALLAGKGVTGAVVVRHHAGAMFGKPARQLAVMHGKVGR